MTKTRGNQYDAVLVLGSGIREDGLLPDSSLACVRKAVEIFKAKKVGHIILSGKWSYRLEYAPPLTEAEAMACYAKSLGIKDKDLTIEKNSVTTVSNICRVKSEILEKRGWKRIILISLRPLEKRARYNLKKVLGEQYLFRVVLADFTYPKEKLKHLEKVEVEKMKDAQSFYKNIKDGDHKEIYQLAMREIGYPTFI